MKTKVLFNVSFSIVNIQINFSDPRVFQTYARAFVLAEDMLCHSIWHVMEDGELVPGKGIPGQDEEKWEIDLNDPGFEAAFNMTAVVRVANNDESKGIVVGPSGNNLYCDCIVVKKIGFWPFSRRCFYLANVFNSFYGEEP